jgi:hypothetical protein
MQLEIYFYSKINSRAKLSMCGISIYLYECNVSSTLYLAVRQ